MPVNPLEVMVGKIIPYIMVGYIQVAVVLAAARWIFDVPIGGNIALLLLVVLVFVLANLTVGIVFSSIARNQMQAIQMSFFFFLPSLLLSGFMFPFRGMPEWAQWLGNVLPLTHFLRIVRGVLLKSWGVAESIPEVWPILGFMVFVMLIGLQRFRRTLD
jgi:ABC-2 type transport system permease protein